MGTAELKNELHKKIDHSNPKQLEQLYGLVLNYFGSQIVIGDNSEELSDVQKQMIAKGLEQADAGSGSSFEDVTKRIREKHGLDG
jgi:hypothetical protein